MANPARTITDADAAAIAKAIVRHLEQSYVCDADREYAREIAQRLGLPRAGVWGCYEDCTTESAVYLLIDEDEIVYVGQSGSLSDRINWHQTYKRFDRVRVLPIDGDARVRCLVEKHVRELVGPTYYESGESVRDRIEMRREGPPVDAEALAGTGPIAGIMAFLRWGLG